jgi:hypothetical protein
MKDILKGLSKTDREIWFSRLKRKLAVRENAVDTYEIIPIELGNSVIEKLNEFCSTFQINRDALITSLICDFLITGEVKSPVRDTVDLLDLAEYSYPQKYEAVSSQDSEQKVKRDTPRKGTRKWQLEYIADHWDSISSLVRQAYENLGRGIAEVNLKGDTRELCYLSESDINSNSQNQALYLEMVKEYNPDKEFLIAFKSIYSKNVKSKVWTLSWEIFSHLD